MHVDLDCYPGIHPGPFTLGTICLGMGDESKLGTNCSVELRGIRYCDEGQRGAQLVGLSSCIPYVCRSCVCNAHNALCNRHGVAPPRVERELLEDVMGWARSLRSDLGRVYVDHLKDWFDAWWLKWPLAKRIAIRVSQALDHLCPGMVKFMVKREVVVRQPTKARGIQFYKNYLTQAEWAVEFTAMQKALFTLLNRRVMGRTRVTVASMMTASDIADWANEVLARRPRVRWLEFDGKNWDATMQDPHLRLAAYFYDVAGPEFMNFVYACNDVRGVMRTKFGQMVYRLYGTTKSGQNDTTLKNSLVNAFVWVSVFNRIGVDADLIVAGDDMLAAVDCDAEVASLEASSYGIVPEGRSFPNIFSASFVSGIFVPSTMGCAFVPKPGRLFARLGYSVKPCSRRRRELQVSANAVALLPPLGGFPVVGVWLRSQVTRHSTAKFDAATGAKYVNCPFSYDGRIVDYFCARYDTSVSEIRIVEEMLKSCVPPAIVSHPLLTRMCLIDNIDVLSRPANVWRGEGDDGVD
jgi:hypothetical protein